MKRIKPQHFLILLLVAAIAAAPFLIRGLIDRSSVGKQPAAAVTAAPEETAEPTPTPEPTPLQFTTVDASYFDDALFIGDSRTVGIAEYGSLKNATYFADVGLNVYVAQTKAIAVKNVGTVTLPQLLSQKTFGKVYIMLGINELGNNLDDITAKFSSLVDTVRAAQPDAIIYVEANLHVGPSRSSTDATFNNPRINQLNEKLAALADGKTIFYIDINELFDDENGNLRADASGDSTHVLSMPSMTLTGATGCARRRSFAEKNRTKASRKPLPAGLCRDRSRSSLLFSVFSPSTRWRASVLEDVPHKRAAGNDHTAANCCKDHVTASFPLCPARAPDGICEDTSL